MSGSQGMNESGRTGAFVIAAAVSVVLALWLAPRQSVPKVLEEEGGLMFPGFTDPLQAASLEVATWDAASASVRTFKVEQKDGKWTIPSHNHYPADGKDRLAKVAALFVDLKKESVKSDRAEDQEAFGVVDPLDENAKSSGGRGKHVTLRDAAGKVLADVIVGGGIEGQEDWRYLRQPGHKRIFAAPLDAALLTARFTDWIESDLLLVERADLNEVQFSNYHVDERTGQVKVEEVFGLTKDGEAWRLEGGKAPKQETVDRLLDTLDNLKIVGVRLKPEGLSRDLRTTAGIQLDQAIVMSLMEKGFYVAQNGMLLSNEGEIEVGTGQGIFYTLRFGEVLFGDPEDVSAAEPVAADAEPGATGVENRYLFVTAGFDPARVSKPSGERPAPAAAGAAPTPIQQAWADYDAALTNGQAAAAKLNDRFAAWYYVIDGTAFRDLRLNKKDLAP